MSLVWLYNMIDKSTMFLYKLNVFVILNYTFFE